MGNQIRAEYEIKNVHKYKNILKNQHFSGSDKPMMVFFLLINVKKPTIVGILTFLSRKNFLLSSVEHVVYNLGDRSHKPKLL